MDLKYFERIHMNANANKNINIQLSAADFASTNDLGEKVLLKGKYKVFVGTSQSTQRSKYLGANEWKEIEFEIK